MGWNSRGGLDYANYANTGLSIRVVANAQPTVHLAAKFHIKAHDSCPSFIVQVHDVAKFQE